MPRRKELKTHISSCKESKKYFKNFRLKELKLMCQFVLDRLMGFLEQEGIRISEMDPEHAVKEKPFIVLHVCAKYP